MDDETTEERDTAERDDSVAQMVENGATVKEPDDDAAEAIAQAAAEDLENLDYTL